MTNKILNILFSTLILFYSIRTIYFTYKEPSPSNFSSTDWKGYSSGIMFSIMSIMSIFGFFDLLRIFIDISKATFELKSTESGIIFASFVLLFFIVLSLIYYRPNKILMRYKALSNEENLAKTKLVIDSVMCYYTVLILVIYLTIKII